MSERTGPQIYLAGTSTVDVHYPLCPEEQLPIFVHQAPIGDKVPTSNIDIISSHRLDLQNAGVTPLLETSGGNALSIVKRMAKLLPNSAYTIRTWTGNDRYGKIIKEDLTADGIVTDIIEITEGITPHGLVVPRYTHEGKLDRTIFSYKPEQIPSGFADNIPSQINFAIVNSLSGSDWPKQLKEGTKKLKNNKTPYIYTPGSTQLNAFKNTETENRLDKLNAVFDAIEGSYILSVNLDELMLLMRVKGVITDRNHIPNLIKKAHQELKSHALLITDGKNGAFGIDKKGKVWHVSAAPVKGNVKGTLGAGDAFISAAAIKYFESEDIADSLTWGSVNGAMAVEEISAHDHIPTRAELEARVLALPPSEIKEAKVSRAA
ncbi:MAG TPA: carbohydrate kinase family protein [Candidatus Sulfotelmatobacter sp.]|jgi:sugar/nucleoside kinase (ribokinase family)|nr:carbohydrate kinase family protein [Candidatus Sulfotelmatobacter sp.]